MLVSGINNSYVSRITSLVSVFAHLLKILVFHKVTKSWTRIYRYQSSPSCSARAYSFKSRTYAISFVKDKTHISQVIQYNAPNSQTGQVSQLYRLEVQFNQFGWMWMCTGIVNSDAMLWQFGLQQFGSNVVQYKINSEVMFQQCNAVRDDSL